MPKSLQASGTHVPSEGRQRNLVLVDTVAEESGPVRAIAVVVVHGDRLARAALGSLLAQERDVAVTGSAADGEEAVALAGRLRPDVLLIDIRVPGVDAVSLTQRIVADPDISPAHVLILGASEEGEEILSSLRAGASGFLARDAEPAELVEGIRAVAAGEAALSPGGARRVIDELASQPDPRLASPEQLEELTAREREVMALVAGGLSNDEIADQLVVTPATAKTHVSRVMSKLRARHRAQLVTLAYETGLVHPRRSPSASAFDAPPPRFVAA